MEESEERLLEYQWIGIGLLYILGLQVMGDALIAAKDMVSPIMEGVVSLIAFFIGGVMVGKHSPGKTIKEPAIAAVIAVAILLLLEREFTAQAFIKGSVFPFVFALVGGYIGEKWQGTI
ncbi:MAG: hypothetical protein ACE5HH_01270 [Candidatus Hydrothermarchaeales archaeon]